MKIDWFTSDLHFGHKNVIEFCHRPFSSLEDMNETLIKNWNHSVSKSETIVVVGDLALCKFKDFLPIAQRLNGRKILVQGNHDGYSVGQYNSAGFDVVQEMVINLCGQRTRLSHFPYAYKWWRQLFAHKSEKRFMEKRPPRRDNEYLIHGHTHSKFQHKDNRIHVGVDAWNFKPVHLSQIESIMSKNAT